MYFQEESDAERELPNRQHFPDVVAAQEELDRSEVAKQIFDVPVIEYAL